MGQASGSNRLSKRSAAARPQTRAAPPTVVIVEERERLSRDYSHVFDCLGIRRNNARSVDELKATLCTHAPMAIIWELAAGFDSGEVLGAISEFDRNLPMLIIVGDDSNMPGTVDSMIRFLRIADVTKHSGEPVLRDIVEFLFRAGRKSGRLRVLSI